MLHQSYPYKTIEWKWNTLTNRRRNFFNGMFSHSQKIYYKKRSILGGGDGNMQLGNRQKSKKLLNIALKRPLGHAVYEGGQPRSAAEGGIPLGNRRIPRGGLGRPNLSCWSSEPLLAWMFPNPPTEKVISIYLQLDVLHVIIITHLIGLMTIWRLGYVFTQFICWVYDCLTM